MNEEIEYAEMLEIPVSTFNLVRKKRAKKKPREEQTAVTETELKKSIIEQVNAGAEQLSVDSELLAESANSEGTLKFDEVPERIDTVRLYAESDKKFFESAFENDGDEELTFYDNDEKDGGRYETKRLTRSEKALKIVLRAEFAVACALCGAIFLTNVFMPTSAINTFFRALTEGTQSAKTDDRAYTEFTLSPIVSDRSDAQLTLEETGVLTLEGEGCLYPSADGKVSEVIKNEDGNYTLKIAYSNTFTGVMTGLKSVFYQVGDSVKANIPVAYAGEETPVQVTMYSSGELLNCFTLTEENCLAWTEQPSNEN